jgi:hypothetical protein
LVREGGWPICGVMAAVDFFENTVQRYISLTLNNLIMILL